MDFSWHKLWGGTITDIGFAITHDQDNNIYIAGDTNLYDHGFIEYGIILIKCNNSGFQEWNVTYNEGFARDIVLDSSKNIYIVGYKSSQSGTVLLLIKYDNYGNLIWNKTFKISTLNRGEGIGI